MNIAKKGLSVPGNIGIAGWGDLPIASIEPYRLTSIAVPHLTIGQQAAELLLSRISGQPMVSTKDVGFRLIPGTTVQKAP